MEALQVWKEYGRVMQSLEIRSFLPVEEVKLPENLTGGRADLSGVNSEKGREKKKLQIGRIEEEGKAC